MLLTKKMKGLSFLVWIVRKQCMRRGDMWDFFLICNFITSKLAQSIFVFVTKNVENQTWRVRELYFSLFLTFVTISPQIYSTTMAEGYLHYHFLSFISKSLRRNSVSHLRFGMHFELTYQTGEFNEPKLSENVFFMYFLWPFFSSHFYQERRESRDKNLQKCRELEFDLKMREN